MRIIIAGSRNFNNFEYLCHNADSVLESLCYSRDPQDFEIISGGAKGADQLGERFAKERGFKLKIILADWNTFGKSAGYRRNMDMAEYASKDKDYSILIAFWDGKSKGTRNMIDIAKKKLNKVFVFHYDFEKFLK